MIAETFIKVGEYAEVVAVIKNYPYTCLENSTIQTISQSLATADRFGEAVELITVIFGKVAKASVLKEVSSIAKSKNLEALASILSQGNL